MKFESVLFGAAFLILGLLSYYNNQKAEIVLEDQAAIPASVEEVTVASDPILDPILEDEVVLSTLSDQAVKDDQH